MVVIVWAAVPDRGLQNGICGKHVQFQVMLRHGDTVGNISVQQVARKGHVVRSRCQSQLIATRGPTARDNASAVFRHGGNGHVPQTFANIVKTVSVGIVDDDTQKLRLIGNAIAQMLGHDIGADSRGGICFGEHGNSDFRVALTEQGIAVPGWILKTGRTMPPVNVERCMGVQRVFTISKDVFRDRIPAGVARRVKALTQARLSGQIMRLRVLGDHQHRMISGGL